jgi:hypothetical protein
MNYQSLALPAFLESVLRTVERKVALPHDQPGFLVDQITMQVLEHQKKIVQVPGYSWEHMYKEAEKEPLTKLLQKERKLWSESWEGSYSAKEEGRHIQRLQAYVQATVDKAAEQLQQQHPDLVRRLQRVLL